MTYRVVLSDRASEQLDSYVRYLAVDLGNIQAASSLLDDAEDTIEALSYVAGSLAFCSDPDLKRRRDVFLIINTPSSPRTPAPPCR